MAPGQHAWQIRRASVMAATLLAGLVASCVGLDWDVRGASSGADAGDAGSEATAPLDTGVDGAADAPVEDTFQPPFDTGVLTVLDSGRLCQACGADCCVIGADKPQCLHDNTCGVCSPRDSSCRGDRDCCNGDRCATGGAQPAKGLCRVTCRAQAATCDGSGAMPCCLGLICRSSGGIKACAP